MEEQIGTTGPDATSRPFDTIEASHEFVVQLLQAVEEAATEVGGELRRTHGAAGREREALQLAAYKLEQLRFHLTNSRRRLRDLRTLRGILCGEATPDAGNGAAAAA